MFKWFNEYIYIDIKFYLNHEKNIYNFIIHFYYLIFHYIFRVILKIYI